MDVVIEVTRIATGIECDFEYGLYMAVVACNNLVTAEQFVFRIPVMVEDRLVPGDAAAVAGVTLVTAMFIVGVVLEVARYAGPIHLVFERVFRVTVTAGQLRVAAQQIEIGIA